VEVELVEVGAQRRVGEHRPAARLRDQVGEFVAGQVVVDRHVYEAGAGAGEESDEEGVGVLAVGGNPVAGAQAEGEQVRGGAGDGGVQLGVGPRAVGEPHGDAAGGA